MNKYYRAIILMLLPIFVINLTKVENKEYRFVLSSQSTKMLFYCEPEDVENTLSSGWTVNHFRSAKNVQGDLVLILSEEDVKYWKDFINNTIKEKKDLYTSDGCRFTVSNNYHCIEVHSKEEYMFVDGMHITSISVYCGIMQMLNGENVDEWYVDIYVFDVATGKNIKSGRFPPLFELSIDDWNKALGVYSENR